MKELTIKLPDPPKGFEYTREYRVPEKGEWYYVDGSCYACRNLTTHHMILREVQTYKVGDRFRCPETDATYLLVGCSGSRDVALLTESTSCISIRIHVSDPTCITEAEFNPSLTLIEDK